MSKLPYHIASRTWLSKQTLDNLNDICDSHFSAGTYDVDCADGVRIVWPWWNCYSMEQNI